MPTEVRCILLATSKISTKENRLDFCKLVYEAEKDLLGRTTFHDATLPIEQGEALKEKESTFSDIRNIESFEKLNNLYWGA